MEGLARAIREITLDTFEGEPGRRSLSVRPLMHELALRVLMKLVFGARREAGEQVVGWFKSRSLAGSAGVEALGEPESPPAPASRRDLQ